MSIRIGTRASQLALWQAEWVAAELKRLGHDAELITISTTGDRSSQSLSQLGGQGVFTKEIQLRLLAGEVDVAVHSLKDLPTQPVEDLVLAAIPARETTRDCLVSHHDQAFSELPAGSCVGTGSARRAAQLKVWRPDICIKDIRGNVDTRLRKLREHEYDAVVLAAAGLKRLCLLHHVSEILCGQRVLPAVGQGALGLECRAEDHATQDALRELEDPATQAAVTAERELLFTLQAGCLAPVAALARVCQTDLHLQARVLAADGSQVLEGSLFGEAKHSRDLGRRLADHLLEQGAANLIAIARS